MSWIHSSRSGVVLALVVLLVAAATPAAAIAVTAEGVPGEAAVGDEVTSTFTITEPFRNPSLEQWSLSGETELENVTWTVTLYDQTDAKVGQESYDGANFTHEGVSTDSGVSEIEVRIVGTVPAVEEFTYDPEERFQVATLQQVREGGTSNEIGSWSAHHYTTGTTDEPGSKEAREAIASAEATIADTNADTGEAEDILDNAVSAYEASNFGNAVDLANKAETSAEESEQSSERTQLLVYAAGGLVGLLVLLGGGYVVYQSRQDDYDKLG